MFLGKARKKELESGRKASRVIKDLMAFNLTYIDYVQLLHAITIQTEGTKDDVNRAGCQHANLLLKTSKSEESEPSSQPFHGHFAKSTHSCAESSSHQLH